MKTLQHINSGEKKGQKQDYFSEQSMLFTLPAYISPLHQ